MDRTAGSDSLDQLIAELQPLVRSGYKANSDDIMALMKRFADDGFAIRHFIRICLADPAKRRMVGTQSFLLTLCPEFVIRLNLWFPDARLPDVVSGRYDEYFSVDVCHNHNYDFFTVGVLGPGYASDFFYTEESLGLKTKDDTVRFSRTWSVALRLGTVLFVEQDTEFHVQYAPDRFSVSLNLIPTQHMDPTHKQFVLKKDRTTIEYVLLPIAAATAA